MQSSYNYQQKTSPNFKLKFVNFVLIKKEKQLTLNSSQRVLPRNRVCLYVWVFALLHVLMPK